MIRFSAGLARLRPTSKQETVLVPSAKARPAVPVVENDNRLYFARNPGLTMIMVLEPVHNQRKRMETANTPKQKGPLTAGNNAIPSSWAGGEKTR